MNQLFSRLFGMDGINPFGHPTLLDSFISQNYEKLEEEVFEVVKNDVKTTIVCKFNKEGYLVSHSSVSSKIGESETIKLLKDQLHEAIDKEDYEKAKSVQEKINKVRALEDRKPTL